MTIRFFSLQRLVARLVRRRRRQVGLHALGACALATLMAGQAAAQAGGGAEYPPAVGGALSDASLAPYVTDVPVGNAVSGQAGVVVGPGGITTSTQLPSVLGPAPAGELPAPYVQQPYASGPFMQAQPVYQEPHGPHGLHGPHASVGDLCDASCDLRYYASAEALYFRRDNDERFSLSQSTRMEPFDYEWGGRITVGRMLDCVNGYELSYVGPFEWERESVRTGVNLQSRLNPDVYTAADISAFNNADRHEQYYRARLNSFEVNKRCFAWDIFSTLIGVRVIDYREDYQFLSTNGGVGTGLYQDSARNIMVGPQVGGDWMTPVGLRTLVGFRGKGAVFANFNRNQVFLQNAGVAKVDSLDNSVDLAGLVEFGTFVKYSVTRSIRLTGGYDFWYMPGVATVPGQGLEHVGPNTGIKTRADEDVFVHGGSFGAEILF